MHLKTVYYTIKIVKIQKYAIHVKKNQKYTKICKIKLVSDLSTIIQTCSFWTSWKNMQQMHIISGP